MWGGGKVTFSIREFFNSSKFNEKIQSDCFGLEEIPQTRNISSASATNSHPAKKDANDA